jgi:hypothetical protein
MKLTSKVVLASIAAAGSVSALAGIVQDQNLIAPEISIVSEAATPVSCQTSNVGQGHLTLKLNTTTPMTATAVPLKWNSMTYGGKTYYYELLRLNNSTKKEDIIYQGISTQYIDTTFLPGTDYTYKVQDMYRKDVPSALPADMVCTPVNASHGAVSLAVKTLGTSPTPIPTASPTPKPTPTPKPGTTAAPTAVPTPTPVPTPVPTPTPVPVNPVLPASNGTAIKVGMPIQLKVNSQNPVIWSVSNSYNATIDQTDKLTPLKTGMVSVIVEDSNHHLKNSRTFIIVN